MESGYELDTFPSGVAGTVLPRPVHDDGYAGDSAFAVIMPHSQLIL